MTSTELQPRQSPPAVHLQESADHSSRLQFAQATLENIQELIRAIDSKASNVVSSVALLTASLGIVAGAAIGANPDGTAEWSLKVAGITLILAYLLLAFAVIYLATRVYRAHVRALRPGSSSPGLIFPNIILQRHRTDGKPDEDLYLRRLAQASDFELLHDYANQIVEVSNVYTIKQRQLNLCLDIFRGLSIVWVVTMLLLVMIIVVVT
jgi:hypothetical protein